MKKLGAKSRPSLEFSSGAMSDIAFLLIIFFIVATTMVQFYGFKVDIPAGEKGEMSQETKTVKVQGKVLYWGEGKVTMNELRVKLADLKLHKKKGQEKVVLLDAGESVPYQTYYDVMNSIAKAGGVVAILQEDK